MKKLSVLALVAAFILSTVAMASAVELKARGSWRVHANWTDNYDFQKTKDDNKSEDDFNVYQRARVWFDFVANENVKAVLGLEIGDSRWGERGKGADLGADDKVIEVKHAYLDFKVPNTDIDVKAGVQGIALPNSLGSAILDDDVAALVLSAPINDMVSLTAGWARAFDLSPADYAHDEYDVAFLITPIKAEGFALKPFFAYAWIGKDIIGDTKDAHAWWAGVNAKVTMFDPIVVLADLNYGKLDADEDNNDRAGWFFDLAVDYKMDMVTPEVFFIYSTGEDDDINDGSERMPSITPDVTATPFVFGGSSFANGDSLLGTDGTGLAAVGLKLKDMSFIENVKHTFVLMYARGTSDEDFVKKGGDIDTLTTKDSVWEVDFNTKYQMYENLAAIVELGYAKANYDEDVKNQKGNKRGSDYKDEAAWKAIVGVKYDF
ncbi:outer membrane homotrimeric porin [Desulfonauticus submarinus]